MQTDLVFPQGNEENLIKTAKVLGFTRLLLCYALEDSHIRERKTEVAKLSSPTIETVFAVIVHKQQDLQKAKHLTEHVVVVGKPGMYEDKRAKYVIDFEAGTRKDFIHHRNSGLTQVSIKKAIASKKILLVNAGLLFAKNLRQETILGRILQNNRFFRKYKPNVLVVSGATTPLEMRAPRDLQNLLQL